MVPAVIEAFFEDPTFVWQNSPVYKIKIGPGITLVTGPSGCGKSTFLKQIVQEDPSWQELPMMLPGVALIDHFLGELGERIALLARFGLGDAQVVVRDYEGLSDGQRFRARLALAIASGARRILVDEFLSTVDTTTAAVVAHNVQRLCRRRGVDLIAATAHNGIADALTPDQIVWMQPNAEPVIEEPSVETKWSLLEDISIGTGTLEEFEVLQRFHYYPTLDFDPTLRDVSIVIARYKDSPIAARLYCAPYPRSWALDMTLLEEVNRTLTLGQRMVVAPIFRGLGLARAVSAPEHAPLATVYTRSVMSRYTDMHSALGYKRHEPLTNGLIDKRTGDLRRDALRVLVTEFVDYRMVLSSPVSKEELATVTQWFARQVSALSRQQLEESIKSTLMGGYIIQRKGEVSDGPHEQ